MLKALNTMLEKITQLSSDVVYQGRTYKLSEFSYINDERWLLSLLIDESTQVTRLSGEVFLLLYSSRYYTVILGCDSAGDVIFYIVDEEGVYENNYTKHDGRESSDGSGLIYDYYCGNCGQPWETNVLEDKTCAMCWEYINMYDLELRDEF